MIAYSDPVANEVRLIPRWKLPFLLLWSKVYNVARRPLVKVWQQRIVEIAATIRDGLKVELLPSVYDNMRQGCTQCRDLYGFLRGQPFTSEIEKALTKFRCTQHHECYWKFYINNAHLFERSHELSDRVCGFKSNRV